MITNATPLPWSEDGRPEALRPGLSAGLPERLEVYRSDGLENLRRLKPQEESAVGMRRR
jgi:hypothetical protein